MTYYDLYFSIKTEIEVDSLTKNNSIKRLKQGFVFTVNRVLDSMQKIR